MITINDLRSFLINSKYLEIPTDDRGRNNNDLWIQFFNNRCEYYKSYQFMKNSSYKSKSNPDYYTQSSCHAELIIRSNKVYVGIHFEDALYTLIKQSFSQLIDDFKKELDNNQIKHSIFNNGKHGIQFEIECFDCDVIFEENIEKLYNSINQLFSCLETVLL